MNPGQIILTPQTHRFFRQLATAQAATVAYTLGHIAQAGGKLGPFPAGSRFIQVCYTQPFEVQFDSFEVLSPVLRGEWPDMIHLDITSSSGPPPTNADLNAIQFLMGSLYEIAFIAYFENNRALIKSKHGAFSGWPSPLAFGRIIRHAFAHVGKIHILDGTTATWGNLTYSAAQNGRRVLYNDLSSGDLTLLMIEMDAQF